VNLAMTMLVVVLGTLGYLGAILLIRMFGESFVEAHRDRKRRDHSFADDTVPDLGAQ